MRLFLTGLPMHLSADGPWDSHGEGCVLLFVVDWDALALVD
jgi:hypothetical protein